MNKQQACEWVKSWGGWDKSTDKLFINGSTSEYITKTEYEQWEKKNK